jgi:DeoR/GlpR family transcriptional regulator of sugar metabolism
MIAAHRHQEILNEISTKGSVKVSEIAARLSVTEETIRRDLDKLESTGKVRREHGGAVAIETADHEMPYWQRELIRAGEKTAIAARAATLVQAGDTIVLDASSTAWFLAKQLPDVPLTVLTNSSQVAVALSRRSQIKVVCVGGQLSPASLSFIGPLTEEMLLRYRANKAFLSCGGVELDRGLSDTNELQARVRQHMIRISERCILMADHSKFGKPALAVVAPLRSMHTVITDAETPAPTLAALRKLGVEVMVAE